MKLSKAVIEKQEEYQVKVAEAIANATPPLEFKKYSGAIGVYPQKNDNEFMVRPRIYSGILTIAQLKAINQLAREYANGFLHLTTRQSFQFHKVRLEDTWKIIKGLLELGIITVGAGGNSIRNIACPPLSGVDKEELFDVTPHALAATNFAINLEGMNALPRKYKIAFSNSEKDLAKATITDLGFIAKIHNGKKGFKLFGAGGVGNKSSVAILLEEFILEEDILYHILAMKLLFEEHGDRTNRNKARIRFIANRLGNDQFKVLYQQYVKKAKEDLTIKYKPQEDAILPTYKENSIDESKIADGIRIIEQKNKGYYALYIHPKKGDLQSSIVDEILDSFEKLGIEPEIRLSNTQGIYIRNLKRDEVLELDRVTKAYSASNKFERSVTCTGAKNCKIGLLDSQGSLEEIQERLLDFKDSELKRLPEIRISGCRNGCTLHQTVELGFEGSMLRTEKGGIKGYKVYVNGKIGDGISELSDSIGTIGAHLVADFVKDILTYLIDNSIDTFKTLLEIKPEYIEELVNEYGKKGV